MSFSFHPQTDGQTERANQTPRHTCDILSLWDYMIRILCSHVQSLPIMQLLTRPSMLPHLS
jgi:hypothetical protein